MYHPQIQKKQNSGAKGSPHQRKKIIADIRASPQRQASEANQRPEPPSRTSRHSTGRWTTATRPAPTPEPAPARRKKLPDKRKVATEKRKNVKSVEFRACHAKIRQVSHTFTSTFTLKNKIL